MKPVLLTALGVAFLAFTISVFVSAWMIDALMWR